MDKLQYNIENETGSFVSTAAVEGSDLKIVTKKTYKNQYELRDNWEKMMEFLEGAVEFTNQKVMLKKVS